MFKAIFLAIASFSAIAMAAPAEASAATLQVSAATSAWCDERGFRGRDHDDCGRYHDRCHEREEWRRFC